MKYNFDTILKEFKQENDESEEDDIFEFCIVALIFTGIICVIAML